MKLSKKLFTKFLLIAIVSILLTAILSTTVFWFVLAGTNQADARLLAITIPVILAITAVVFVICIFMSKRSTQRIIEPIKAISQGEVNTAYDELVPLTDTINSQKNQIKKQTQKVQVEKDKITTLIDNMSEGFLLIDLEKNVLMSNHSAKRLLATNESHFFEEKFASYIGDETVKECIDSAINGESKNGDAKIKGKNLQIIANPVYSNEKQNGVICIIIDVSAKKKAEKMRREFTANVTHELKTPLTSISGYAEIIASGLVKSDDIQGFAKKIHKESGRLLSLISDIMELSQLDESVSDEIISPVDLASVAGEVVEDLRSNAQKHGVEISIEAAPSVINGNRGQLYELVYNLCDNAIRYNRPQGTVKITVTNDNEHPCIMVSDTGIGIPEKHHKRIFERFYRVDKSRSKETGGTGLGLAIVKHIAEKHGGTVTLKSSEEGTTFTVAF